MSPPARSAAPQGRPPLHVRGALLVDGTGAPGRPGDALVVDGRIAELGDVDAPVGARVLDAGGLVLAPGFVDLHAHSDLAVLSDPEHLAKTTQGVTTEVLGQDGLSYAPVDDASLALLREQLAGWNGTGEGLGGAAGAGAGFDWRGVGEYLDRVDAGAAVNVCYLVPQGTVRMLVVGTEDRPADPAELDAMRVLVRTGLAEGAVGMSSGLTYVPGMFAATDELVALAEVVAEAGGFYAPHQRSYGHAALQAYAEVIEVARRSGVALHLTHATMNFAENAGRARELLDAVDAGTAEGLDITLDSYPYLPGSTTLAALLPSWASAGGPARTLERLADPLARRRIRTALEVDGSDGCHGVPVEWHTLQVSGVRHEALADAVGLRLDELARRRGAEPFAVFVDLLRADRLGTTILQHVGHEENVREIMRHPRHCGGSDGLLTGARPHPRAWGTFPRYLGHYVRETGVLSLEDCVAHLTSRPAAVLGLRDRGTLRPGAVADLVLFDPATVAAGATFEEPRRPAVGIPHVLVAGVPVVADSRRTGDLPGRSLRSGRDTEPRPAPQPRPAPPPAPHPRRTLVSDPSRTPTPSSALAAMTADRVVCVVRAPQLPDAQALCHALADGGIRTVELTFTTPDVLRHLREAAGAVAPDVVLGVGTVVSADDARAAIDAGARFLVTPGLRPAVAAVATAAGVPILIGALTPTEVLQAHEAGASAVKVFPASAFGPSYLSALHGPHPDVPLVPSGGVTADNARDYLDHGALAVTAGTGVVPPGTVAAGDWAEITRRAREFVARL